MNPTTALHTTRCIGIRLVLVAAVLFTLSPTHAQNLVPNPGFEETDSCTFGLGMGALHDWFSAFLTPDHLQSCLPYGSANGLPLNIFTYQQPFEGNSCAGILTYDDDTGLELHEWIMVHLLEPLAVGQTYYCSFRANAAFGGNSMNQTTWLASDHLGMLFTTYDRQWTWGDTYPATMNQAQILHPQILSDTVGWTLVGGSFLADSAYTYLMIGNFFSNALVDTLHLALPGVDVYGYTLIDAVCVSSSPEGCELSHGVEEPGRIGPFVYPNPATDVLVIGNSDGRDATVLDMQGRCLWRGRVAHDRFVVDVSNWGRGAYVVQVRDTRGVQTVKFVLAE